MLGFLKWFGITKPKDDAVVVQDKQVPINVNAEVHEIIDLMMSQGESMLGQSYFGGSKGSDILGCAEARSASFATIRLAHGSRMDVVPASPASYKCMRFFRG